MVDVLKNVPENPFDDSIIILILKKVFDHKAVLQ
jgi:hypothetical protein